MHDLYAPNRSHNYCVIYYNRILGNIYRGTDNAYLRNSISTLSRCRRGPGEFYRPGISGMGLPAALSWLRAPHYAREGLEIRNG